MEALPKPIESRAKMSSETSIVQCPACSTKFSLKTAALEQQPSARFHCSRCDHVFSLDLAANLPAASTPKSIEPEPSGTPRSQIELDFRVADAHPVASTTPSHDFKVSSVNVEPPSNRPTNEQTSPLPDFRAAPTSVAPKINTARSGGDPATRSLETFSRPQPLQLDFSNATSFSKASETPDTQIRPYAASARKGADGAMRSPGRWSSAGILMGVLFACLLSLAALGFVISISPSAADRVFALAPSTEQAAPADIFVRAASIEQVILDGGQNVTVLSGTLQNESLTNYRSVEIEAALYDGKDQPIASVITSTSSGLAKDQLKTYPPAMLDVLQRSKRPRSGEIKAGDRKEFMAVFTDEQAAHAKFFSTRVYTVTE